MSEENTKSPSEPTPSPSQEEDPTANTKPKPFSSSLGAAKSGTSSGLGGGLNFGGEKKGLGAGLGLGKDKGFSSSNKDKEKDKEGEGEGEGEGEEDGEDTYEPSAVFTPVVTLPEVEVKTMEEEEEILACFRVKLYIYGENLLDKGTGKKGWNERGVGEIKLLKHNENEQIRVLMRQEKTMKIVANHMIDPRYELVPNAGSNRSWVYTCFDFSNGESLEETVMAIRFGTVDDAEKFKEEFDKAKVVMKKVLLGEDDNSKETNPETEDVSKALDSLTVSKTEGEEGEKK